MGGREGGREGERSQQAVEVREVLHKLEVEAVPLQSIAGRLVPE